jgi:hypothetical protein
MRTLIYKRTHKGDPDKMGCFGIWDCMGRLRNMAFDAVIGVGGTGAQPEAQGISYKINWIGVRAHKTKPNATMFPGWRGPFVTFDHFVLFENKGVDFWCVAPILARRMYAAKGPRFLLDDFTSAEWAEIRRVLKMAIAAGRPSRGKPSQSRRRGARCC